MTAERLEPGDEAPDFTLPDADGNPVSLSSLRGQRVIVYFYPAAMTPGCTKQACDFTGAMPDLKAVGLAVLGISPDGPAKLAKFREKEQHHVPAAVRPGPDSAYRLRGVRREDELRQEDDGRDPLHVRHSRRRQGREGVLRRQGHRARRAAAKRPRRLTSWISLPTGR